MSTLCSVPSFLVGLLLAIPLTADEPAGVVQVGDVVADVSLTSIDDEQFTLSEAVAEGPVVLVLYRGVW